MNIFIKETGVCEKLCIFDQKTGVNWISDFIGNSGAFNDGQFTWDDEKDAFVCSQETFDWWENTIRKQEELDLRISELSETYGEHKVFYTICYIDANDMESYYERANQELDEEFGE